MIDVARARRETPGCEQVIHFNNAGASLMPRVVLDAVQNYFTMEAQMGGYEAEDYAQAQIERFYDATAALIGAARDEIAFCESATRAWDMAFYAIPFQKGDRVLIARAEYGSNAIALLQVAKRTGAQIDVIPSDDSGQISLDALREMMDERVKLIAVTHVPTNGGLVNPAVGIGQIAREAGVWYLLDACQSVGQMPVNVDEIGCDFLSATGRKFLRGPRGTGFLYVRRSRLDEIEPPFLDLQAATWTAPDRYEMRSDARRFEAWESSFASKVGLAAAIDYALDWGLDEIYTRIKLIAGCLRDQLRAIPGVTVRDLGVEPCGIVTFTVDGYSPDEVKRQMAAKKINVTVSRAGSTLLDMQARELTSLVRASVHYINTEAEVGMLCEGMRGMKN